MDHNHNNCDNCNSPPPILTREQWNRYYNNDNDLMDIDYSSTTNNSTSSPSSANMVYNFPQQPIRQGLPPRSTYQPISASGQHSSQYQLTNRIDELLEDWPRQLRQGSPSYCQDVTPNLQDWQSLSQSLSSSSDSPSHPLPSQSSPRNRCRGVTFSAQSSMRVYHPDPHYMKTKAYTKKERQLLSKEAISDALRIKHLMLSFSSSHDVMSSSHSNTSSRSDVAKSTFKYLIKHNIISLEEIVGIEHLVFSRSPLKIVKERKEHARVVLKEQYRMLRSMHNMSKTAATSASHEEQASTKVIQEDPSRQDDMKKISPIEMKLGELSAKRSLKNAKRARVRAAMAA